MKVTLSQNVHHSWITNGYEGPRELFLVLDMPFAPYPGLIVEHADMNDTIEQVFWMNETQEFDCRCGTFSADDVDCLLEAGWKTYEQLKQS